MPEIPQINKTENESYKTKYNKYKKESMCNIYKIVYGWLFKNKNYDDLQVDILNQESDGTQHGRESSAVIRHIGLDEKWKNYIKNNEIQINEAIEILTETGDPQYNDIIKILKEITELISFKQDPSFANAINVVKSALERNGTEIKDIAKYDGLIVVQLTKSSVIKFNKERHNQTHIDIKSKMMDIFPYLRSKAYFDNPNHSEKMKSYFVLKTPVILDYTNISYLHKNLNQDDLNHEKIIHGRNPFNSVDEYLEDLNSAINSLNTENNAIITSASIVRSIRQNDVEKIEISRQNDGNEFKLFRKLLFIDDYLIILKLRNQYKYEFYGIKNNEPLNNFDSFYYPNSEIEDTQITADQFTYLNKEYSPNKIFYGAPGTGKSFTLNKNKNELLGEYSDNFERVTFHPDYSYANFVGTYKPVQDINKDGEDIITYKYSPGPFIRTLVKALNNPSELFILIIEEINRANVYSVFGDIFQLLDRDEYNFSEYPIDISEDLKNFLKTKDLNLDKIYLPSNMFIWATMNSADQGVFPIDTAFKRRWDFEYMSINSKQEKIEDLKLKVNGKLNNKKITEEYKWNTVRKAINNFLLSEKINEDKQMGPFFIQKTDSENVTQIFLDKVLMYLYEDAAKSKRELLFSGYKNSDKPFSYLNIVNEFKDKGYRIFNEDIRKKIEEEGIIFQEHKEDEGNDN